MTKTFEMTIAGNKIKLEDKSHAGIFRQFFAHFIAADLDKTVETIDLVGIRTSDSELFIAKNGSKKKNIRISDTDRYIYTHLTPAAMQKAYEKFIKGWEGKWQVDAPVEASDESKTEQPAEEQPKAEMTEEEWLESDEAAAEVEAENKSFADLIEKSAEEIAKDEISMEDFGTPFSELLPTQKGRVTKKYNKQLKDAEKSQDLTSEEVDEVDM